MMMKEFVVRFSNDSILFMCIVDRFVNYVVLFNINYQLKGELVSRRKKCTSHSISLNVTQKRILFINRFEMKILKY